MKIFERIAHQYNVAICSEPTQIDIEIIDPSVISQLMNSSYLVNFHELENYAPLKGFGMPRFNEAYMKDVIHKIGGNKIPEGKDQTPDFIIGDTVFELKAIESDSLFDKERQNSVGEIFKDSPWDVVNLDPKHDLGEYSKKYIRLIESSLKGRIKAASNQIKDYKKHNSISSAGAIILNTGMFSLPHELAKRLFEKILANDTKTVEFVLLVSQFWQSNWMDSFFFIQTALIGHQNECAIRLRDAFLESHSTTMTNLVLGTHQGESIDSQSPVSFFSHNKLFFWSPGPVPVRIN